jgi:hypothetical protein
MTLNQWLRYRLGPRPDLASLADESGLSTQLLDLLLDERTQIVGFRTPHTHRCLARIRALQAVDDWNPVEHVGHTLGFPVPHRCPPHHGILDGLDEAELRSVAHHVGGLRARRSPFRPEARVLTGG